MTELQVCMEFMIYISFSSFSAQKYLSLMKKPEARMEVVRISGFSVSEQNEKTVEDYIAPPPPLPPKPEVPK